MITLNTLQDLTRYRQKCKRVGRGPGSGTGKTCGRGEKGAGSRSGYKRRFGYEGGQFRLYMKLPIRGFNNARFRKEFETINLEQINYMFEDGDVVNRDTLAAKGFFSARSPRVKLLANGELTKKVTIEVNAVSRSAQEKIALLKTKLVLK